MSKAKRKSSPRSSGGIGDTFENQVSAFYLTSLLLDIFLLGRLRSKIKRIYFQGKEDWVPIGIDDLTLIMDTKHQNKTFIQIKIDLTFSDNNDFRQVMTDCWIGFRDSKVSLNNSDLMMIAVSDSENDFKTFKELLRLAETAGSVENFITLVTGGFVSSPESRMHFKTIRSILKANCEDITDVQIWQFLRCLRVVYFDMSNIESHKSDCIWALSNRLNIEDGQASLVFDKLAQISACLRSAGGSISRQELIAEIRDLVPNFPDKIDRSLVSVDQYSQRPEIKPILEKKFIGRKDELTMLQKFLDDPNTKIMLLSGRGGVGKTRLVLEFANNNQSTESKRSILFVQTNSDIYSKVIPDNSLLVVDDARTYVDLNKIIDHILASQSRTKLLLIENSTFFRILKNLFEQKPIEPDILELQEGDIATYLKFNFPEIEENVREKINLECLGVFDFAKMLIEYYKEESKLSKIDEVISQKIAKYVANIHTKTDDDLDTITFALDVISYVMPLYEDFDLQYLKRIFSSHEYNVIERILQECRYGNSDLVMFLPKESKYTIKPDPLADLIRSKALRENTLLHVKNKLLLYMPYRIIRNLYSLVEYDETDSDEILQKLVNIWDHLNANHTTNEYFLALETLVYILSEHSKIDELKRANIPLWIDLAEKIMASAATEEGIERIGNCFANSLFEFQRHKLIDKAKYCLEFLRKFNKAHNLMYTQLASGIALYMTNMSNQETLTNLESYLDEVKKIYTDHKSDKVKINLEMAYANMPSCYTKPEHSNKVEQILNKFKELSMNDPPTAAHTAARSYLLGNAILFFCKTGNTDRAKELLLQLLNLHSSVNNEFTLNCSIDSLTNCIRAFKQKQLFSEVKFCNDQLRILRAGVR